MAKNFEELLDEYPLDLPEEIADENEYQLFIRDAKRLVKKGADQPDSEHAERFNALLPLLENYQAKSVKKTIYKHVLEKRISVTLPISDYSQLKDLAYRQRLSVTFLVKEAIQIHIKNLTQREQDREFLD